MQEVESSNPDDGYTHFRAGLLTSTCELLIDHKLRPVVRRLVGSRPTVSLDTGQSQCKVGSTNVENYPLKGGYVRA